MIRHTSARLFLAALFSVAVVAGAWAADANGTWTWKTQGRRGDQESTATFKVDGDKLTGSVDAGMLGKAEIKNGTFKNDEVSFESVLDFRGNAITTKYSGKVEGDTIKGKMERTGGRGGAGPQDWNATRKK